MDVESVSCATRFWRRRRRKNPKTAKTTRARPPITPPTIGRTGIDPFEVEVAETVFPVDVGSEDSMDDVVDDDDVPFWIMRKSNVRGVESFPSYTTFNV